MTWSIIIQVRYPTLLCLTLKALCRQSLLTVLNSRNKQQESVSEMDILMCFWL